MKTRKPVDLYISPYDLCALLGLPFTYDAEEHRKLRESAIEVARQRRRKERVELAESVLQVIEGDGSPRGQITRARHLVPRYRSRYPLDYWLHDEYRREFDKVGAVEAIRRIRDRYVPGTCEASVAGQLRFARQRIQRKFRSRGFEYEGDYRPIPGNDKLRGPENP